MDCEKHKFRTKAELEAILDKIENKYGLEPLPPCLGHIHIWYQVKNRKFKGGIGVFIGQAPAECVEEFRLDAIRGLRSCATVACQQPIDEADKRWGEEISALLDGCNDSDVQIVDWTYKANDD